MSFKSNDSHNKIRFHHLKSDVKMKSEPSPNTFCHHHHTNLMVTQTSNCNTLLYQENLIIITYILNSHHTNMSPKLSHKIKVTGFTPKKTVPPT
uniref:Uncharacterized protein n=1 Tax=Arion vulgaris TaxID=1028688 RepID=A0A0B7A9C1_9EUPU